MGHKFNEAEDKINSSLVSCYNSSICAEREGCQVHTVFFTIFFLSLINTITGPCVHMPLRIDELHNDPWDSRAQPCALNDSLDSEQL